LRKKKTERRIERYIFQKENQYPVKADKKPLNSPSSFVSEKLNQKY